MKAILIFVLAVLTAQKNVRSQNQSDLGNLKDLAKVPTPPSPNASALGKFGEIPVGLSTGIPNINIPFYKYSDQLKGLNLDVSLSYHAGGHKVEDIASNVGLGWALNAGGVISRTLRGRPDEDIYGYLNTPQLPYLFTNAFQAYTDIFPSSSTPISDGICIGNYPNYYDIKKITDNQLDGECDIFQFSFNGHSGKFFFRKDGSKQLMTQSNLKVEETRSNGIITSFKITDDHGVQYIFNVAEWTEVHNSNEGTPESIAPAYISSWYLSEIISADTKDKIVFRYNASNLTHEGGFSYFYRSSFKASGPPDVEYLGTQTTYSFNVITTSSARISSIELPDGTSVQFQYNFPRLDYAGDNALTSVHVKNQGKEKVFKLTYSYFESPSCDPNTGCLPGLQYSPNDYYKRLKLNSIQQADGGNLLPPHTFEYNTTPMPTRNSLAKDWWGYYSGDNDPTVISPMPIAGIPNEFTFIANRKPSKNRCKAWVMEKINYPTGGHTRFYYELNEGIKDGEFRHIGGLRTQRTEDYDPVANQNHVTNYSYKKTDNSSSGTFETIPNFTYYWTSFYNTHCYFVHSWFPCHNYHLNQSAPPSQTLSYFNGSPVIYTRVKVDKDASGLNNGYSIHEFTGASATFVSENSYPYIQKQDIEWNQGLPVKESQFNSSGSLLRSLEYEYNYYLNIPLLTDGNSRNLITGMLHWDDEGTPAKNLYSARSYVMAYGRSELKKTTEKVYDQTGAALVNVKEISYDGQYYLPKTIKTQNSKGNAQETRIYYPFDYTATGLTQKANLLAANRLGEVISQELWEQISGTFYLKKGEVTDYNLIQAGSMLKPSKSIVLESNTPFSQSVIGLFNPDQLKRHTAFKDQIEYLSYDNRGRITEIKAPGNTHTSFIWDLSNSYPVASFVNATFNKVAYTSFESLNFGNWVPATGYSILSTGGVTGKNSFNGSLTVNVPAGNYIVSAWAQGNVTVNNVSVVSKRQAGLWNFYEWEITGVSVATVAGTNIDEVRLLPKGASVTTYSYNPLLGLTSQCNSNNELIYYEYDGFGRLYLVKNEKGQILKKICYNYQGQIEYCSGIASTPVWVPTGTKQCKPCIANTSFVSGFAERLERDVNPASATYDTYRWVDDGLSLTCVPQPYWQIISTACELNNGINTGNQILTKKDMNPCSPTFNTITTTVIQNHSACPPPGCNTNNCTGVDKKCVNNNCETGYKVYTSSYYNPNTGLYECTYHYEWSDNSWSQDYIEYNQADCPIL